MSLKMKKIQILTILFENLKEKPPQLVPSTSIAAKLDICLADLRQLLKSMEGMGVIETDPEQQYNLITPKGLSWLDQ
jgi:predicted transcriptional regulator